VPAVTESSLTLAGPGRAGRAFLRSWASAGGRVAQVITHDTPGIADGARFGGATVRGIRDGSFEATDLLIVSVPDDAIAACAEELAGRLRCAFAFHLSGALGADALAPPPRCASAGRDGIDFAW